MINIININKDKAFDYISKEFDIDKQILIDECCFYNDLNEVFEYIYLDENDNYSDYINTIRMMAQVTIEEMQEIGANNIAEYLALTWDWLYITPYGYVKING